MSRTDKQQFYAAHLDAIASEGRSIAAYAKDHDLCAQTLYYWRRKLSGERRFVRVRQRPAVEAGGEGLPIQIRFPNGVAVSVAADAAALPEVLRALANL